MTNDDAPPLESTHPYTLRGVRQMLGLTRHAVSKLIELGFVDPSRGPGRAWRFSFRDVVLLRSAHDLRAARIPTRQILRTLRRLRDTLPPEAPVNGLRITAVGDRIIVREEHAQWEPDTGQLVMDFSVAPATGSVSFIAQRPVEHAAAPADDIDTLFEAAEDLESSDPEAALQAYRRILAQDPAHAHAYLNLGFMLCEAGRSGEAVALYDEGIAHCADDPLMHYNRAVALEDVGRVSDALAAYEACLRLQPDFADAHQNAALLYAQAGQKQMAIRHFSAFRRLQPRG
ncbi:tetratricopeptide repeat protein [Variovorax sp. KK3]|uniref:tetratricopeptide repeat protein n=1 Tax=Variovorax sp. KK3 TaxID=1855728 RepID=UPI0009F993A1|nr:tetratricopeptide repeat protein [Variovorax sp. KK3]